MTKAISGDTTQYGAVVRRDSVAAHQVGERSCYFLEQAPEE